MLSCRTIIRSISLGALVGSGEGVGKGVKIYIVSMKRMRLPTSSALLDVAGQVGVRLRL